MSTLAEKKAELARLQAEAVRLKIEIDTEEAALSNEWEDQGYYLTYYATSGFFLGMIAALASLVFNIVGASAAGKDPLQLIRVYLTFGMGERALDPAFDNGLALAMGCVLYIATGMLLGILFQVLLGWLAPRASVAGRLVLASVIATGIWLVNFYVLISWMQPLLFGGNWIIDNQELPWWVALATHLGFGWAMALIYPWGVFKAPAQPTPATSNA